MRALDVNPSTCAWWYAKHIDAGKLKVKVAQRYPIEQAGAAQEEVLAGHAGGKVVLTI